MIENIAQDLREKQLTSEEATELFDTLFNKTDVDGWPCMDLRKGLRFHLKPSGFPDLKKENTDMMEYEIFTVTLQIGEFLHGIVGPSITEKFEKIHFKALRMIMEFSKRMTDMEKGLPVDSEMSLIMDLLNNPKRYNEQKKHPGEKVTALLEFLKLKNETRNGKMTLKRRI